MGQTIYAHCSTLHTLGQKHADDDRAPKSYLQNTHISDGRIKTCLTGKTWAWRDTLSASQTNKSTPSSVQEMYLSIDRSLAPISTAARAAVVRLATEEEETPTEFFSLSLVSPPARSYTYRVGWSFRIRPGKTFIYQTLFYHSEQLSNTLNLRRIHSTKLPLFRFNHLL